MSQQEEEIEENPLRAPTLKSIPLLGKKKKTQNKPHDSQSQEEEKEKDNHTEGTSIQILDFLSVKSLSVLHAGCGSQKF